MDGVILDISNKRIFQDVAFLVDRKEVIQIIHSIRHKFKNTKRKQPKIKNLAEMLLYGVSTNPEVNDFLKRLKYPPGFNRVIVAAVENNRVSDSDARNSYFWVHTERVELLDLPPLETPRNSVLVTIYPSLIKNRKGIIIGGLLEGIDRLNKDKFALPKNHPLSLPSRRRIKEEREWYWKNKKGTPSGKILDEHNQTHSKDYITDVNIIDQAISDYRKTLDLSFGNF